MYYFSIDWETPFQIQFSINKENIFEINDITLFNVSLTHKQYERYLAFHDGYSEIECRCREYAKTLGDWRH
jgi:hypothetical protein